MNFRKASNRREDPTIDLMPLIDVVFLLLLFFLITTSFSQNQESKIPIDLPTGVSGQDVGDGERVVLVVSDNGEVSFEGNITVEGDSLQSRLEFLKTNHPEVSILLRGDSDASHGRVVEILDTIKVKGFTKVNLVIKKKQK